MRLPFAGSVSSLLLLLLADRTASAHLVCTENSEPHRYPVSGCYLTNPALYLMTSPGANAHVATFVPDDVSLPPFNFKSNTCFLGHANIAHLCTSRPARPAFPTLATWRPGASRNHGPPSAEVPMPFLIVTSTH